MWKHSLQPTSLEVWLHE